MRLRPFVRHGRWLPLLLLPVLLNGQRRGRGVVDAPESNPPYDGKFIFTRIRYDSPGGGWGSRGGGSWAHDYPRADLNLPQILDYVTTIKPRLEASSVLTLEDPEIFRTPIIRWCGSRRSASTISCGGLRIDIGIRDSGFGIRGGLSAALRARSRFPSRVPSPESRVPSPESRVPWSPFARHTAPRPAGRGLVR